MKKNVPILIVAIISLLAVAAPAAEGKRPPNVLFISIDDMRAQTGAYGNAAMLTPNLDRIASEGRLFERHYVQVPTCGPSRACMLTGKNLRSRDDISHQHLANTLAGTAEGEQPETVVHHFKKNGYRTVGMGKISHSESGFHFDKVTKKGAAELPHSWTELLRVDKGQWKGSLLHGFASGKERKKEDVRPFESADVEDDAYPDGMLAAMATAKLSELAKGDEPFLMAVGFFKPHLPFTAPKKYWDLYDRSKIPLSPNPEAPDGVDPVFLHDSSEFRQYRKQPEQAAAGKRLSDDYAREIIHANFAAVSFVDAQVGKVLDQLKATGLDKNTIVVVWGDHGWHLGDHTIWGKHSTFEKALNSLLIVKTPMIKQPGVHATGLVASVDLYPTLCELTNLPKPGGLEGESFAAIVNDPGHAGKNAVISYWRDILSLRTDRYRMAFYNDGKKRRVMLFDHRSDPNESRNVATENPDVVKRLTALLKQKNEGFLPEFE